MNTDALGGLVKHEIEAEIVEEDPVINQETERNETQPPPIDLQLHNELEAYKKYTQVLESQLLSLHSHIFSCIQSVRNNPLSTICKTTSGATDDSSEQSILNKLIDHFDKNGFSFANGGRHDRHSRRYDYDSRRHGRSYSSDSDSSDGSDATRRSGRRSRRLSKQTAFIEESEGDLEITDVFDMQFWKDEVGRVLNKKRMNTPSKRERPRMEEEFTSDDEDSRPVSESPRDIDYERRPRNGSLSQNNIAMRPPDSGRKRSASDTSVTEPPKKRKKRENLKIDFESKTTSKQAVFYRTPVEINPKFATFLGRDKISKGDAYKRIWEYIKEKGLQKDPADKTRIFCDDTLRDLLEPEEDVIPNIWTLNNLVKQLLNNEERLPKPKVGVPASPSSISPPPPAMTPTWNGGLVQSPMLPTPPIKTSPQTMIQSGIPSPLKQPTTPTGMYKSPQAMPPGVPVRPSPTVPKPPQQPTWPNASTSSLMNFSAVLPNLQPPQFLMSPQQHPQQLTKVQLQRLIEQQKQPQQTQQRSSFPHLTSPTHFEPK